MSTQPELRYTEEEYLAFERTVETKHEYLDGMIYAMVGASPRHVQIVGNIARELGNLLRDKPCLVYASDLRVCTGRQGLYAYPDVVVVCGEAMYTDEKFDTLTNPILIVEVLSPSTNNYDRGEKFARYRTNNSLREYLLVAQDSVHVEHFVRQDNGDWVLQETTNREEQLALTCLGCSLPVSEIYFKVKFESPLSLPKAE